MKSRKKLDYSMIGVILLIAFSFFAVHVLSNTINQLIYSESITLAGAFALEENRPEDAFRQYLEGDQEERNLYIETGRKVAENAGYSFSAQKIIANMAFRTCGWKLIGLFTANLLGILGLFFLLLKKKQAARGLTERLETEKDHLRLMEDKHAEEKRLMNQFEENLYHQIKTPLTSLHLCVEQLQNKHSDLDKMVILTIQAQLRKLSRLATQFLKQQKLITNMVKYHFDLYSIDDILTQAVDPLKTYAAFMNTEISFTTDGKESFLHCDYDWILEAFTAILENAVEHAAINEAVQVRLVHEENQSLISICTPGTRIEHQEMARLFERYYTTSDSHFGIGLHMSKMIIEAHHGCISVRNLEENHQPAVLFEIQLPNFSDSSIYSVTS